MRLIDADALQKALANMWYESQISVTGISVSVLIDEQPTVDAVEVVRCRDCRWRREEKCPMYHEDWFEIDEGDGFADGDYEITDNTEDGGFCHCGEKRSE